MSGGRAGIALVVGDDLHPVVLPHADARVGGAEIDPDRRTLALRHYHQLENGSMKIEEGDVALSAATNECEDLK